MAYTHEPYNATNSRAGACRSGGWKSEAKTFGPGREVVGRLDLFERLASDSSFRSSILYSTRLLKFPDEPRRIDSRVSPGAVESGDRPRCGHVARMRTKWEGSTGPGRGLSAKRVAAGTGVSARRPGPASSDSFPVEGQHPSPRKPRIWPPGQPRYCGVRRQPKEIIDVLHLRVRRSGKIRQAPDRWRVVACCIRQGPASSCRAAQARIEGGRGLRQRRFCTKNASHSDVLVRTRRRTRRKRLSLWPVEYVSSCCWRDDVGAETEFRAMDVRGSRKGVSTK